MGIEELVLFFFFRFLHSALLNYVAFVNKEETPISISPNKRLGIKYSFLCFVLCF